MTLNEFNFFGKFSNYIAIVENPGGNGSGFVPIHNRNSFSSGGGGDQQSIMMDLSSSEDHPVPEGDLGSHLKGDIIIPDLGTNDNESSNADYNTLDEPIMNTIVSW